MSEELSNIKKFRANWIGSDFWSLIMKLGSGGSLFPREDARGAAVVASENLLHKLGSEIFLKNFYLLFATPFWNSYCRVLFPFWKHSHAHYMLPPKKSLKILNFHIFILNFIFLPSTNLPISCGEVCISVIFLMLGNDFTVLEFTCSWMHIYCIYAYYKTPT